MSRPRRRTGATRGTMRAYYLDQELTGAELDEAAELLGETLEPVRIPYVLPAPESPGTYRDRPMIDESAAIPALKAAGILKDYGQRVALVIPDDVHWYAGFSFAIHTLCGYFPYLVQTSRHREGMDNPGDLRVLDLQGLMT